MDSMGEVLQIHMQVSMYKYLVYLNIKLVTQEYTKKKFVTLISSVDLHPHHLHPIIT